MNQQPNYGQQQNNQQQMNNQQNPFQNQGQQIDVHSDDLPF